jgi:tRNA U34 5-methylaminomethyl-2-thiouridine-forming methyltransferase MnmC
MKAEITSTADGSYTLHVPELDEHYHSIHGALAEARHVFIEAGLKPMQREKLSILEMGFGTGLNAFLSFLEADRGYVSYTALEAFPLDYGLVSKMQHVEVIGAQEQEEVFAKLHTSPWGEKVKISSNFDLLKVDKKLDEVVFDTSFNLIYYDAFGPRVQPELWTEEVFAKLYAALTEGGVLVTYCAKGSVKRALKAVGFHLESLPGPPGKREMTRAKKIQKLKDVVFV